MRRLTQRRVKTFYLRQRTVTQDAEGVSIETFGEAIPVKGEVWPATSRRQVEQYGDRISGIQNMCIVGAYSVDMENGREVITWKDSGEKMRLGDGICINADKTDEPDYMVIAFTPYGPLRMEVERRVY